MPEDLDYEPTNVNFTPAFHGSTITKSPAHPRRHLQMPGNQEHIKHNHYYYQHFNPYHMRALGLIPMLGLLAAAATACQEKNNSAELTESGLDPAKFIATFDGDSTALYTLRNSEGMEVCITNFGARIVSVLVPDRDGKPRDVVLGFDSIQAYFPENNSTDFGAAIGRYANRINQGRFVLDTDTFQLPRNNYGHCLHGGADMGSRGWQYRVFTATQENDSTLRLTLESPDGDNGFPGKVNATVTYTLTNDNAIDIA